MAKRIRIADLRLTSQAADESVAALDYLLNVGFRKLRDSLDDTELLAALKRTRTLRDAIAGARGDMDRIQKITSKRVVS